MDQAPVLPDCVRTLELEFEVAFGALAVDHLGVHRKLQNGIRDRIRVDVECVQVDVVVVIACETH